MRQAVRVGRQILLARIRSQGKTGIQSVAAVSSKNVWAAGALDGPVFSDFCFEGSAIIRPGGSTHPLLQATPNMGRTRWILILCAWTIVGLLFAVRRIVLVKLMGTQVSWVTLGALELVYWYVWAAYTPLVIGLAKRL